MTDTVDRAYDWDDEIENDGGDFTLLPNGEYPFTVIELERERYGGSDKLPPCNMAIVHLKFDGGVAGTTTLKHRLYLHSKTEGLLCAFFTAIGQRQHGEKMKMDWSKVVGYSGRAKLGSRKYTNDSGAEVEINDVKKFLDPQQGTVAAQAAEANAPQASYTTGSF
ncbi:MAG: DUF669 domain-containing protein [Coriobacteriia bacterium]